MAQRFREKVYLNYVSEGGFFFFMASCYQQSTIVIEKTGRLDHVSVLTVSF